MPIRYLINDNGKPFNPSEIASLTQELDRLSDGDRENYRNNNASKIASHPAIKTLIVSGPGTGKSYLFLDRINNWFNDDSQASVLVTSFVRKLVADLQNDIDNDKKLTKKQKANITVTTLHKFARSIVEKNHGTWEYQFKPHLKIIGESWKDIVWSDVLAFFSGLDSGDFNWKMFEKQLHNNQFDTSLDWSNIKDKYFGLCKFYNASGFADLILRAKIALEENPSLNSHGYFIVDEYQDFNLAEDSFINQLTLNAKSLLIVGDDEQVLYEKLKSGKAELIRNRYKDTNFVNGMLPFCGRCSFHITKATSYFIQQCRDGECIEKIYLPIKRSDNNPKIQMIACASPTTAVDYIEKFVADNKIAVEERKEQLAKGEKKDAFLLILTPAKQMNFFGQSKDRVIKILSDYQAENRSFTEDYYKILSYYSLANNHNNNFAFRKVMYYEGLLNDTVHSLIENAIDNNRDFCDLNSEETREILNKCDKIKTIIDSDKNIDEKIRLITRCLTINDKEKFKTEFGRKKIGQDEILTIEHEEDEEAELEEIEVRKMGAVELVTIVGSKGLSADHVIIVGFDNVNMGWVTKNAFYVAMTRARNSLHILTSLKSGGSQKAHVFLDSLPENNVEFYSYRKKDHSKSLLNNRTMFNQYLNNLNSISRRN